MGDAPTGAPQFSSVHAKSEEYCQIRDSSNQGVPALKGTNLGENGEEAHGGDGDSEAVLG